MIRVIASSVIDAPVEIIWPLLRDFGAISQWLPGVAESRLDEGGGNNMVGSTRHLTFENGGKMRERLLALSDVETSITFSIIESELPVENYVSTITLQPVTDGGRCFITWSGEFDTPREQEEAMRKRMLHGIYQPGFDSLKQRFGKKN